MNNVMKSRYGSVSPYTRHAPDCPYAKKKGVGHKGCSCPKWVYVNVNGVRTRRSLSTPSWSEALREAQKIFEHLDPVVAEAHAMKQEKIKKLVTVEAAGDLWINRTIASFSPGTVAQYRSLWKRVQRWADREGILYVNDITPVQMEQWYASTDWHGADSVRSQRWGVLRSIFSFLVQRGVISQSPVASIKPADGPKSHAQGPYTDEQIARLFAQIDISTVPPTIPVAEQTVYPERMRTMLTLLIECGCDLIDAVLFDIEAVETLKIAERTIHVWRYRRQKTGVEAVVPLSSSTHKLLRDVAYLEENPSGMPFRSNNEAASDVHNWSRRIKKLLGAAGVDFVEVPGKDRRGRKLKKAANAKMFRHTFAVRHLKKGQRAEEVAKMLGHVDTAMVRKHYAPWVKGLDEAHILRVVAISQ